MSLHPSTVVASELARTVLVKNYFYRIRMEAAKALVAVSLAAIAVVDGKYSTSDCDYIGHFLLEKLFQSLYCHASLKDETSFDADVRPDPNDFSDFADYFLKKVGFTFLRT